MEQHERDAPPPAPVASVVLGYGTHDRAGPWWRRWLRAWRRAAMPALLVAVIAAALGYTLAPRQYVATATVQAEVLPPLAPDAPPVTPATEVARAATVARSIRSTALHTLLVSSPWRELRLQNPGKTLITPLEAEAIPGTKTVRIRFTDPNPHVAQAAANLVVDQLHPVDDGDDPSSARAHLLQQHDDLVRELGAMEKELAATSGLAAPSSGEVHPHQARVRHLTLRYAMTNRQLLMTKQRIDQVPLIRRDTTADLPRFPHNQWELAKATAYAAGIAFPLAFVVALYWQWRYRRTATVQLAESPPAEEFAGPRAPAWQLWRAATRRAALPAAAGAMLAAAIVITRAPWTYTATATFTIKPPPAGAPATQPSAAMYDTAVGIARSGALVSAVSQAPQWHAVRGGTFAPHPPRPAMDAWTDGKQVWLTFTDYDAIAARVGADAAVAALPNAMVYRGPMTPFPVWGVTTLSRELTPEQRKQILDERRLAAQARVRLRPPALAATPATVSRWPSNWRELAAGAAEPAAKTFAGVFLVAILWFYRRLNHRRAPAEATAPRAGGGRSVPA